MALIQAFDRSLPPLPLFLTFSVRHLSKLLHLYLPPLSVFYHLGHTGVNIDLSSVS